jgi:hypothetical protein
VNVPFLANRFIGMLNPFQTGGFSFEVLLDGLLLMCFVFAQTFRDV